MQNYLNLNATLELADILIKSSGLVPEGSYFVEGDYYAPDRIYTSIRGVKNVALYSTNSGELPWVRVKLDDLNLNGLVNTTMVLTTPSGVVVRVSFVMSQNAQALPELDWDDIKRGFISA